MTENRGPIVLFVDDDKFLLDLYSVKFTQAGYSVVACFSVREALSALTAGLSPDIVIFDITMPGEDGFSFLQSIRDGKLAPRAALIALTNQSSDEDKKRAEELGVNRYVIKASMIPSEVVNMVKEELAKQGGTKA